jgi:predicted N-acyltransferase
MYTVKIEQSINHVHRKEWDALIDDDVLASYGWLRTVEQTYIGDDTPRYILIHDSEGLVGAAICYVVMQPGQVDTLDDTLFGRLNKYTSQMGLSFLPSLICCPKSCYGKHFLVRRLNDARKTQVIMNTLLETIETLASEHKLSIGFPNIMSHEVDLVRLVKQRGYIQTLGFPLSSMEIRWQSFDDYLAHLKRTSSNIGKSVRREMNKNRKEGVTIETLDKFDGHEDRLYELISRHYTRHNVKPFPFKKGYLRALLENMGHEVVIYVARKRNDLIGVCLVFKKNQISYMRVIGVDHRMAGNDFTYFNLAYYRPIADAIQSGMRILVGGQTMYETKTRRGFKLSNTYIFYKPNHLMNKPVVKLWFMFLSRWYKNKIPASARKKGALRES